MSNILTDLSKLTIISKKLSELHVKTLNRFCFIALENISRVDIEYCVDPNVEPDLNKNKAGYVKFIVYKKNERKSLGNPQRKQKDRFDDIKKWTQSIFWNDIEISFFDKRGKRLDGQPNRRSKKVSG